MAKRYHHSVKGGHDLGPEYYAGEDPRRRQEAMDASMIHEDHQAPANMPQGVIMKPWPKEGGYMPEVLDDTIGGIDKQMSVDNAQKMRHFKPHKY
jgi:hypothetical protein